MGTPKVSVWGGGGVPRVTLKSGTVLYCTDKQYNLPVSNNHFVTSQLLLVMLTRKLLFFIRFRARFKRAMVLSAFICTALGCVMPVVNMFGLLAFSAPVTVVLVIQIKR